MPTAFRPHPAITARVDVIGRDRAPILVIEHFAADPDNLVDMAERAFAQTTKLRDGFPGLTTAVPEEYALSALEFLRPTLARVFDLPPIVSTGGCDFQVMTTKPENLTESQRIPHIDVPDPDAVASVHFLCAAPFRGTAFYRHKATGFEVLSPDRLPVYQEALSSELRSYRPEGYFDGDSDCFERIASYEPVYNRLIVFSAASLHSGLAYAGQVFDSDPRRGRLTANMFLQFRA